MAWIKDFFDILYENSEIQVLISNNISTHYNHTNRKKRKKKNAGLMSIPFIWYRLLQLLTWWINNLIDYSMEQIRKTIFLFIRDMLVLFLHFSSNNCNRFNILNLFRKRISIKWKWLELLYKPNNWKKYFQYLGSVEFHIIRQSRSEVKWSKVKLS